jgi:hypothetical protein
VELLATPPLGVFVGILTLAAFIVATINLWRRR